MPETAPPVDVLDPAAAAVQRAPPSEVLSIVLPALNEEEAIGATIERCLSARDEIRRAAGLADVEVIVVSDGSTDHTAEIARSFADVRVIEFPTNRGYGAAIKEGFRTARGQLLGFLDADGTCDPRSFAAMCRAVLFDRADMALGARLGRDSHMPRVRRIGNRLYAVLLGILTGRTVSDTASGMRVLARSAYDAIAPLPDGLHFTPSMSARALILGQRVVEVPMPYAERIGTSKLHVVRDGVRFLRAIMSSILWFRPDRPFTLSCMVCLVLLLVLGAYPIEFYLHHRRLEEWMFYRFMASLLLSTTCSLLVCTMALAHRMARLGPTGRLTDSFLAASAAWLLSGRRVVALVGACTVVALVILWPGIVQYATTLTCTLHWSRVVVASFFLSAVVQALVTATLMHLVDQWAEYQRTRADAQQAGGEGARP